MKTDNLKLCPFCGGEATLNYSRPYFVKCSKCFAKSGVASTPALAVINWNTRKPMDRIVEKLEKWKQEADEQYEDTDSELYKMASIGKCHAYKQAIEIVKEGGKDE